MEGARFNKAKLQACLEQDRYRFHPDVWKGFRELQIDLNDALYVLRHGTICEEPEFDANLDNGDSRCKGQPSMREN